MESGSQSVIVAASKNKCRGMESLYRVLGKTMKNRAIDRERELWGAFIESAEVRAKVNSEDFVTSDYRLAAQEVHDFEAGKIKREEMRHLPLLMESNGIPHGVKYIDGLVSAVKQYSRAKRLNRECLMSCWATNNKHVESIKKKVSDI